MNSWSLLRLLLLALHFYLFCFSFVFLSFAMYFTWRTYAEDYTVLVLLVVGSLGLQLTYRLLPLARHRGEHQPLEAAAEVVINCY